MRVKGKVGEIIDNLTVHFFTRSDEEWTEYDHVIDWHVSWNQSITPQKRGKVKKNKKSAASRIPFSPELPKIVVGINM